MKFLKRFSKIDWIVLIANIIGLAASLYLYKLDFLIRNSDSPVNAICDINKIFSCTTIAQSKYAYVAGFPVSLIGILGYMALFGLYISFKHFKNHALFDVYTGLTLGAFVFSLYLTYIEAFILKAYCPYCLISAVSITIMTVGTISLRLKKNE